MANFKFLAITFIICLSANYVITKIVLPNKLRYLENMLNSDVMAKAAKIRQRIEANPNLQGNEKNSWPLLLAKLQEESKKNPIPYSYSRRFK